MKPSARSQFFSELEDGLMSTEFSARLSEELEAHLDDMVYQSMLSDGISEEQAEKKALQQLGDPQQIKKEYNTTMRKMKRPYLIFELAAYLIMQSPLTFLFFISVVQFFEGSLSLGWFLGTAVVFAVLVFFFYSAFQRFRGYINKKEYLFTMSVFVLVPLFLTLTTVGMIAYITWEDSSTRDLLEQGTLFLFTFTALLAGYTSAALIAERLIQRREKNVLEQKSKTPLPTQSRSYVQYAIFLLFAGYLLLTSLLPEVVNELVSHWLFWPRELVEFLFLRVLASLFSHVLPWFVVFWVQAGALCFLLLFCTYSVYRFATGLEDSTRSFPLLKACIGLYIFVILFFLGNPSEPVLEWHVPVEEISTRLEKQQTGPLYRYLKGINADDGDFAYRFRSTGERSFRLEQSSRKVYTISNIQTVERYAFQKSKETSKWFNENPTAVLPTGFFCDAAPSTGIGVSSEYRCKTLKYHDNVIYTQWEPNTIVNIVLSENKGWALIGLDTGFYDPHYVYLVDLRGL